MNDAYVERFGKELKLGQGRRHQRQIRARCRHLLRGIAARSRRRSSMCATPSTTTPSRSSAPAYSSARFSFLIALAGLIAVVVASAGLIVMVRRRVCKPIVDLTATMSRLASGDVSDEIAGAERGDEIGAMAAAVRVFKDNMIEAERLAAEKEAARTTSRCGAPRCSTNSPARSRPRSPNWSADCRRHHP